MAIALLIELPGATKEQYEGTLTGLQAKGISMPPEGQLAHVSGPIKGGWFVLDVWENEEVWNRFVSEHLGAIAQEVGFPPVQEHMRIVPVHSFFTK